MAILFGSRAVADGYGKVIGEKIPENKGMDNGGHEQCEYDQRCNGTEDHTHDLSHSAPNHCCISDGCNRSSGHRKCVRPPRQRKSIRNKEKWMRNLS